MGPLDNHMYEYDLCWIVNRILDLSTKYTNLSEIVEELQKELKNVHVDIDDIQKFMNDLLNGNISEPLEESLVKWANENLIYIISKAIKNVYFGLTSNGYFCAYIPSSWSDITFDTGAVYGKYDYGRLILRFNAEGDGVINNTGTAPITSFDDLVKQVQLLYSMTNKNNKTLYTSLEKGGK